MSIKKMSVSACAGLLALGGCATYYKAETAQVATLTLSKGITGQNIVTAGMQTFTMSADNRCSSVRQVHNFGPLKNSPKTLTIDAGRRLSFHALARAYTGLSSATCENHVAFTPRPGETYRMVQQTQLNQMCRIDVVAVSTGREPDDLERLEATPCVRA